MNTIAALFFRSCGQLISEITLVCLLQQSKGRCARIAPEAIATGLAAVEFSNEHAGRSRHPAWAKLSKHSTAARSGVGAYMSRAVECRLCLALSIRSSGRQSWCRSDRDQ